MRRLNLICLLSCLFYNAAGAQEPTAASLESVRQYLGIQAWHDAGYQGQGVRVGIIDVGFQGMEGQNVIFPPDQPLRNVRYNHGTLVYEVLAFMAPRAEFYLFQLNPSGKNIAEAVDWMIDNQVQVVNYSVSTLDIPLDGNNYQAQQVGRLADANILVVTSVGNHGRSFITGVFKDENGDGWHEFETGYQNIWAAPFLSEQFGESHLRWQDVYTNAQIDLDLYVFGENGRVLLNASTQIQQGREADWPYEDTFYPTTAGSPIYIGIRAKVPRSIPEGTVFYLYSDDTLLGHSSPEGSLSAPADSPKVLAVGAIEANEALWSRSARGPTWDGRIKPDLVAPTRLQLQSNETVFTGTSASTPLVAGAAALIRGAFPELSESETRSWLASQAIDLGEIGADNQFGYGRLWLPHPSNKDE